VDFLACEKSKYLLDFPARRVFRHAGTDVTVAANFSASTCKHSTFRSGLYPALGTS